MKRFGLLLGILMLLFCYPQSVKAQEEEELHTVYFSCEELWNAGVTLSEEDCLNINMLSSEEENYAEALAYIKSIFASGKGGMPINISQYNIPAESANRFVDDLNNDCYEIRSLGYSYGNDFIIRTISLDLYDNYLERKVQLEAKVNEILSGIDYDTMGDVEIALYLHDYLVTHTRYAYKEYLENTLYTVRDVYTAYGPLVNGYAVCQGYALAYELLANRAGLPCTLVSSAAMNHAWNLIYVNDNWYHVDATWDDPVWNMQGYVSHSHFLASDERIKNILHHSGWTEGIECTDTSFDSAWWIEIGGQIYQENGYLYYQQYGWESNIQKRKGNTVATVKTVPYNGYVSFVGPYCYVHDAQNVYRWDRATAGDLTRVFTLSDSTKQICAAFVGEDYVLNYQTSFGSDSYETADLANHQHSAAEDDGDCTTPVYCLYCKKVMTAAKQHERVDDGDCTTADLCKNCSKTAIAATTQHVMERDDGDCTTPVKCTICDVIMIEAKEHRMPDSMYCPNGIQCANCLIYLVAPGSAHVLPESDGDCTHDLICTRCNWAAQYGYYFHDFDYSTANYCTESVYCSRKGCRQFVPAMGHIWDDSVVTVAPTAYSTGEKVYTCMRNSSHQKKDVIPKLEADGLVDGGDGSFYYYEDGTFMADKYGFINQKDTKYLIVRGKYETSISGLYQDPEHTQDWYYLAEGRAQTQYTGLAQYDGAWFYIEKGLLNRNVGGTVEYDGGRFFVADGRIVTELSGLAQDPNTGNWYYFAGGQAQIQYTGLTSYDGEWFYVKDGILADDYTGYVTYDGARFYVKNGMLVE